MQSEPLDPRTYRQRVRYNALRRKIFAEMGQAAAKWRLTWILPFNLSVLALLFMRGCCVTRAAIQGGALLLSSSVMVFQAVRPGNHSKFAGLMVGTSCYFVTVAVTGGLASPVLITGTPILIAASFGLAEPRWSKRAFFAFFGAGFVVLALLSHTWLGELA